MRTTFLVCLTTCLAFLSCQPEPKETLPEAPLTIATSFDGTELSFSQLGKGDTALVFVHGWCIDGSYFEAQMAHFGKRFRTVSLDLPGHGKSGSRANYRMEDFGKDVQAVVETLDLKNVILVGHSMSEISVLEAATRMPERVIGLLGIDTFVDPTQATNKQDQTETLAAFEADFQGTINGFLGMFLAEETDSTVRAFVQQDMGAGPPETCTAVMAALFAYEESGRYRERLAELTIPIRTVNAYPPNREAWAAHYADFEVVEISGVGHYPMVEQPERLIEKLEEALGMLF